MPDSFVVECVHCGAKYEATHELLGKEFLCDGCGKRYEAVATRFSTGVYSPEEAQINAIKQLLHGYGSTFAVFKEFIQNAEDAGSTHLHFLYIDGVETASHPLLHGPSLLIADNGHFTQKDSHAIPSLHLGTKPTDERAIGKFGIGLKSVFLWCDAFFYLAKLNPTLWGGRTVFEALFNLWKANHSEWDVVWNNGAPDALYLQVHDILKESGWDVESPWLAFWVPLRTAGHAPSFSNVTFADNFQFFDELKKQFLHVAKSLPNLRCLRQVALCYGDKKVTVHGVLKQIGLSLSKNVLMVVALAVLSANYQCSNRLVNPSRVTGMERVRP